MNFDYRTYLEDFKVSYIRDYIQKKSKKYTNKKYDLISKLIFYVIISFVCFIMLYNIFIKQ